MIKEYLNEPLEIGDIIASDNSIIVIDHFVEQETMTKIDIKQVETHLRYHPSNPHSVAAARVDLRGWIPYDPPHTPSQITIRNGKVRKIKIEEIMGAPLMQEGYRNEIIKISLMIKRGEKIKRK